VIPPTGKAFDLEFYSIARWDNGQIVEENLMYDLVTFGGEGDREITMSLE